jgi:hypothetical protein
MFQVSISTAFLIYLAITLGSLLCLLVIRLFKKQISSTQLQEKILFSCEYCHLKYIDKQTTNVTQCPHCESFNSMLATSKK